MIEVPFTTNYTFSVAGTGAGPNRSYVKVDGDISGLQSLEGMLESAAPTGGPTTPVLDVTVQGTLSKTSHNAFDSEGVAGEWVTILDFADAAAVAFKDTKAAVRSATQAFGSYLRLRFNVTTAAGTATYGGNVRLLATGQ